MAESLALTPARPGVTSPKGTPFRREPMHRPLSVSNAPRWLPAVALALLASGCPGPSPPARVVVAVGSGPATLDPDLANEEQAISILGNVYEPLVERDAGLAPVPALATYWLAPEGERRWTFRLRDGARFHDGRALEADDVMASLERTRARPDSVHDVLREDVERIVAEDARTVSIWTRYPLASLPDRLTNVRIARPAARAGDPPVGSGPYRVESWTPGGGVRLRAVAPELPVRELEFRVVADPHQRAEQLAAGRVDLVPNLDPRDHAVVNAQPGLRLRAERGLRVLLLGMDCAGPDSPFRDVRVRRALALGVDRDALVRGPMQEEAVPIAQVVTPTVLGYDPALVPPVRDLAAARRLLAQAGHAAGLAVELDFMPDKYRAMPAVAQALVAQLAEIGLGVTLRPRSTAELLERVHRRTSRFFLIGWMTTGWDAGVTYEAFFHSQRGTLGGGCANPHVDQLLERAEREFDMPARGELYRQVARSIATDVAVVPLYQQVDLFACSARLEFAPRVDGRILGPQLRWRR